MARWMGWISYINTNRKRNHISLWFRRLCDYDFIEKIWWGSTYQGNHVLEVATLIFFKTKKQNRDGEK